jgi:hypothetical protein
MKPSKNCIYKTIYFWKELGTRKPVQVLGNISRTGSGNLTIETVYIETGGGRYPKFVYKSSPKKIVIKKNSTVSEKESDLLSLTVEFFFLRFFFLGELMYEKNSC